MSSNFVGLRTKLLRSLDRTLSPRPMMSSYKNGGEEAVWLRETSPVKAAAGCYGSCPHLGVDVCLVSEEQGGYTEAALGGNQV